MNDEQGSAHWPPLRAADVWCSFTLYVLLPQLLEEGQRVHVAFTGEFGPYTTSPRQLTSEVGAGEQPGRPAACLCRQSTCLLYDGTPHPLVLSPALGTAAEASSTASLCTVMQCSFSVRTPYPLSLQFLSKLVNLQGIVTRCTLVRPKIVKSVHW